MGTRGLGEYERVIHGSVSGRDRQVEFEISENLKAMLQSTMLHCN